MFVNDWHKGFGICEDDRDKRYHDQVRFPDVLQHLRLATALPCRLERLWEPLSGNNILHFAGFNSFVQLFLCPFFLVGFVNIGFLCVDIEIPQGLLSVYPHSQASAGAYGDDPVSEVLRHHAECVYPICLGDLQCGSSLELASDVYSSMLAFVFHVSTRQQCRR